MRVFEKRLLRRMFGHKKDELTGEWKNIHKEELNYMYCSAIIFRVIKSRKMRWAGHVARMGRGETYTGFWWGNLRKSPLGRPRRRWEDNIKMDFQEGGCGCMDWIELAQDRDRWRALVNVIMELRVP